MPPWDRFRRTAALRRLGRMRCASAYTAGKSRPRGAWSSSSGPTRCAPKCSRTSSSSQATPPLLGSAAWRRVWVRDGGAEARPYQHVATVRSIARSGSGRSGSSCTARCGAVRRPRVPAAQGCTDHRCVYQVEGVVRGAPHPGCSSAPAPTSARGHGSGRGSGRRARQSRRDRLLCTASLHSPCRAVSCECCCRGARYLLGGARLAAPAPGTVRNRACMRVRCTANGLATGGGRVRPGAPGLLRVLHVLRRCRLIRASSSPRRRPKWRH